MNSSEEASWPEKVERVQIFPSVCFFWLLHQYLSKRSTAILFDSLPL